MASRRSGLPTRVLCTFPVGVPGRASTREHRSRILGDTEESDPGKWELGGTDDSRRFMPSSSFTRSRPPRSRRVCDAQRALLARDGRRRRRAARHACRAATGPTGDHEPFGFHDGIAQPSIAGISGEGVPTGEFILGYPNHYRIVPPTPVVPAELDAERDPAFARQSLSRVTSRCGISA